MNKRKIIIIISFICIILVTVLGIFFFIIKPKFKKVNNKPKTEIIEKDNNSNNIEDEKLDVEENIDNNTTEDTTNTIKEDKGDDLSKLEFLDITNNELPFTFSSTKDHNYANKCNEFLTKTLSKWKEENNVESFEYLADPITLIINENTGHVSDDFSFSLHTNDNRDFLFTYDSENNTYTYKEYSDPELTKKDQ